MNELGMGWSVWGVCVRALQGYDEPSTDAWTIFTSYPIPVNELGHTASLTGGQ